MERSDEDTFPMIFLNFKRSIKISSGEASDAVFPAPHVKLRRLEVSKVYVLILDLGGRNWLFDFF